MSENDEARSVGPAAKAPRYVARRWRTTSGVVRSETVTSDPQLSVSRRGEILFVHVGGSWSLRGRLPGVQDVRQALATSPPPERVVVEEQDLEHWDTSLLVTLARIQAACAERTIEIDMSGTPAGAQRLLQAARTAPLAAVSREVAGSELAEALQRLRQAPLLVDKVGAVLLDGLDFLGCTAVALAKTLTGRTQRLGLDLTLAIQEAGVGTLPILAFISVIGGAVLSLLATQQMDKLGASLLAPNLVAIVIVRELAALTTGLALAGRLGSANAADLATMAVGEEVEGLRTIGVDPFDLLVAPRVLALVIMGPFLVLYATAFGLLGSIAVGVGLMDIPAAEYLDRTQAALGFPHAITGLIKGAAFGFVVGMAGCYHGLSSGRGPAAIGRAVRAAVVSSIVGVVGLDAAAAAFFKWIRF